MLSHSSPSVELLETFVTLLHERGNATLARQRLGITQPSISKRLKRLRGSPETLGTPWLARRGKAWEVTPEGQRVLPAVAGIVDQYENLLAFIRGGETDVRRIRFGCGQQAAREFVRKALAVFRAKYPEVNLQVSTLRGKSRIEGVANGSLALATVTHEDAAILAIARRELHIRPIKSDRLALVCARETPWSVAMERLPHGGVHTQSLAKFPLVLPAPDAGIRRMLDRNLRSRELVGRIDIAVEAGGWQTILEYVSDGLGVGIVRENAIPRSAKFIVRVFDAEFCPPAVTKIICRYRTDSKKALDLNDQGKFWYDTLVKAAKQQED